VAGHEIAPGLERWTAVHPEWVPEEDDLDSSYGAVGSVYYEGAGALVLIDPLVPSEDSESFLDALDRDIERSGTTPQILVTIMWHVRSAQTLLDRYPGSRLWAHEAARDVVGERASVTDTFVFGETLPGEIVAFDAQRGGEALFWIREHRALVAGDVLLGTESGGLRLCPESWLAPRDPKAVREGLRALLDLPIERVLVSHGPPVMTDGRTALAAALA
jgi:glyoxylase-like metal-dependent hydrolase (beta-lactamase superfamily II)